MGYVLFIMLAVGALVFFSVVKQARLADESWARVAGRLRMRPSRGGLFRRRSMGGRHLGFPVRVWTFTRGGGKSSQVYTRFEVRYPSLRLGLQLEHQGLASKIKGLFGAQDLVVGNRLFDDNVVIKGRNVRDIRAFLTPPRRVRILRALESFPGLVIMDARLVYTARGLVTDAGRLERTVRRLCSLAQTLVRLPSEESEFDRGLAAQQEGRLDEALDLVGRAASGESGDVDARVVRGQILLTTGRYDEAAEVLEEVGAEAPEDEQVRGLAGTARRLRETPPVIRGPRRRPKKLVKRAREVAPAPAEEPAPAAPPPPAEPEPLPEEEAPSPIPTLEEAGFVLPEPPPPDEARSGDGSVEAPAEGEDVEAPAGDGEEPVEAAGAGPEVEALCVELFGPDARSFDSTRIFEEKYAGRAVSWSGELVRVDSYHRDMVFGEGPASRATFLVHEVDQGGYGTREVQAVVQLPEGTDDRLRDRRGETLAFEGELVRCDAFMRNLYVASGRLVEEP